jgi:hypothetical protein
MLDSPASGPTMAGRAEHAQSALERRTICKATRSANHQAR